MDAQVDSLQIEIEASSTTAEQGINDLASALTTLKNATKSGAGLGSVASKLKALNKALEEIQVDTGKIASIVSAVNNLATAQKASGLISTVNSLQKLGKVTQELENTDLTKFAAQMTRVADAIRPLALEMDKVSKGFQAFPIRIQRLIGSNAGLASSNNALRKSYLSLDTILSSFTAKVGVAVIAARRIGSVIGSWIRESNDYVENLNLFTVAMGEYAEEAQAYAEEVSGILGLDISDWMRNQGVFMTLATGFGVASDRAALMSKNLTQLGYDLSSFFNIPVEDAMQKLQSGISGELEPLRRLGYDLSQARLEAVALSLGIDQSVASMTQAQKAQLRYYAIMTQVTTAQGDLARTLQAPANQLRIFQASVTQAARALGNIFIPALNAVLPYVIAFVNIVRRAAEAIASFFDFELPEIDYSGISVGVGEIENAASGMEDSFGGAASAAKELKATILGFDQLNVMNAATTSGSGGGGGTVSGGSGDFDFPLPEYDFLGDAIQNNASEIEQKLLPVLEDIARTAIEIGGAFAAWKISNKLIKGVGDIVDSFKGSNKELTKMQRALRGINGLILITVGAAFSYDTGYAIGSGTAGVLDYVKGVVGAIASGIGGAQLATAIGLSGGIGFAVGLGVAVVFEISGIIQAKRDMREEAEYQEAVQSIKDNAIMTVQDAFALFNEWYVPWQDENKVVIDLLTTKENLDEELQTAYTGLQETFDLIIKDGSIAADEFDQLKASMEGYFTAITASSDANNAIIHEALVGALSRASEDGQQYYQDLIDKHNEWIITEQGAVGAIQQQANDAVAVLATASPETEAYAEALQNYSDAMQKLGEYTNAENTAKLQTYAEQIEELKEAINSGKLDTTDVEAAKKELEELAGKYNTTLEEIEQAREGVMVAVQTEINRATQFGNDEAVVALGDIKSALEADFDRQREDVIAAADNIGATIAQAIGSQMFNLSQTESTTTIQKAIDEQFVPLLEAWSTAAGDTITNSKELLQFPQLALDTIQKNWNKLEPDLDSDGQAVIETWGSKLADSAKESVDSALNELNLGKSAMDGITTQFGDTKPNLYDLQSGADNMMDGLQYVYDSHSPAGITKPLGKSVFQGIEAGIEEAKPNLAIYTDSANAIVSALESAFSNSAITARLKGFGTDIGQTIASGISGNSGSVSSAFTSMLNTMLSRFETFISRIRSALNTTLSNFSRSMSSVKVSAAGKVTYSNMSPVYITRFATGGFPDIGQLFLAREAGPELVGTMGGRTAVANNEQIEQGIYRATYDANSEQNALLREQNDLLRRLLDKDVTAYISTSDIVNGLSRKNRRDGKTVVPVGNNSLAPVSHG